MFLALGLLVFPSRLDDVAVRGTVLALVLVFVSRPVAVAVSTPAGAASRGAERARRSRRPGCAAPCPWCSRPSRSSPASAGAREFFDVVFFAVLLSTLLQGTTFEPLARALGATTTSRRCRARWPRRGRSGGWAPRSSSTRSPTTTRSSARACATSGCRARRWSTSSCAATRRSRRAARPPARRRPPARAAALGALARRAPDRRALAPGADRAAAAPAAAACGRRADLHRRAVRPGAR